MLHSRLFYVYGIIFISMDKFQAQSEKDRRLLLHTADDIAAEFQMLRQEIQSLQANFTTELATLKDRGSTYIRWGRTICPGNGTDKVYSGYTAGSPFNVGGGAASFVCLPDDPTWSTYKDGIQNYGGYISGSEYEGSFLPFSQNMVDEDAPCVLCHNSRSVTIMIPGRMNCYPGWSLEYTGYLMTGHYTQGAATDYACVDSNPEAVFHGEANMNGKLLYMTEVNCGSLPCQEYPNGRELACVVCSK
ncbi:hypothetical protein ACF0H5_015957 [Mactra antiquata]